MNSGAQIVLEFLWKQSWQVALLFPLVWIACRFLRGASAHWRYLLWLVLLVKCFVPATFDVSAPVVSKAIESVVHVNFDTAAVKSAAIKRDGMLSMGAVEPSTRVSWGWATVGNWVIVLWAICGGVYLFIAVLKGITIQQKLRRGRTWPDMQLECEFVELVQMLGIKSRPKLCLIRDISQPFVWGIVRGCIYLPEGFSGQGTERQRRQILAHELAHVLRWDAFVNALQMIAQAIFIFHPLVWWMNKCMRHEREKCCDEIAIAALGIESHEYGDTIVERLVAHFEPRVPASALAISGHAKELEDRIKTILLPGRTFHRRPTFVAALTVFIVACVIIPMGLAVLPAKMQVLPLIETGVGPVDLSGYVNVGATASDLSDSIAALRGDQLIGGIPFRVAGAVQLAGTKAAESFPTAVRNLVVGGQGESIHLLHCASGTAADSSTVATLILHYSDGSTADMPILYGVHVRDYWFTEFQPLSSPSSVMAWGAPAPGVRGGSIRLYRTTLNNPKPQSTITHIDYVSGMTEAAPVLVALTVQ